jgi:site-specific DNA-methyltransferase (adenine-specific)
VEKNKLYYGDNLEVLRQHVKDESVDLIYLDPPFNSRQNIACCSPSSTAADESSDVHTSRHTIRL